MSKVSNILDEYRDRYPEPEHDWRFRAGRMAEDMERLELQIKHPQGGFCSYCGHHFEYGSEVSEVYWAKVVEHMSACEKAPFQKIMQPLMLILDWMDVNLQEAECRGDEDCDHCYGLQLLEPFKAALASGKRGDGK